MNEGLKKHIQGPRLTSLGTIKTFLIRILLYLFKNYLISYNKKKISLTNKWDTHTHKKGKKKPLVPNKNGGKY